MKTEYARDRDGDMRTFAYDVGGVKDIVVNHIDDYEGGYELLTSDGRRINLFAKPSFFFLLGYFYASEEKARGFEGFVSDPEVVAPLCRFLIHLEEYEERLERDAEAVHVPLFQSRREAIAYLRKAGIRVHGDPWYDFDTETRPYPDPDTRAHLRKMGL